MFRVPKLKRLAITAGIIGPLVWCAGVLTATVLERGYLRSVDWSPVHRSEVEWPSILMLGPNGWLVSVLFVVCGAFGVVFAAALLRTRKTPRWVAVGVGLIALTLAIVAVPPDAPGTVQVSWHDRVHNWAYPIIPILSLLCMLRLAVARPRRSYRLFVTLTTAAALGASTFDAIAQIARYVLFTSIVVWLVALARDGAKAIVRSSAVPHYVTRQSRERSSARDAKSSEPRPGV